MLAYTLGLRHAFDADHISAIDNSTRKVLGERHGTSQPRPFGFGFFFSLGHSTVVVAMGVAIMVAEKTVFAAVSDSGSPLERFGGLFGTVVSASFLLLIGLLNLVILAGIARVFRSMRRGEYDEAELERQLAARGLFYRFFGRWMRAITKEWQLYPVGVLFGLGFDTATTREGGQNSQAWRIILTGGTGGCWMCGSAATPRAGRRISASSCIPCGIRCSTGPSCGPATRCSTWGPVTASSRSARWNGSARQDRWSSPTSPQDLLDHCRQAASRRRADLTGADSSWPRPTP